MPVLAAGTILHDVYLIETVVATGVEEEGPLYSVVRPSDNSVLLCQDVGPLSGDNDKRRAYLEAVELASTFVHPNLARVIDNFSTDSREYIVLEGSGLQSLAVAVKSLDEAAHPFAQLKVWGMEMCEAFGYLEGQTPRLMLDSIDPNRVMVDAEGHLKLADYRLGRCLAARPAGWLAETAEDKAVNYRTLGKLIAYMVTRGNARADYQSVRTIDPRLEVVVQRCDSFLQSPGLSFYEIGRTLQMAIPADRPVTRKSRWARLRHIPPAVYLGLMTAGAALWAITWTANNTPIAFKPPGAAASPVVYVERGYQKLDIVDADTGHRLFSFPAHLSQLSDMKLLANGKRLVRCDPSGLLRSLDTKTYTEDAPLRLTAPAQTVVGGALDRVAYAVGSGVITEFAVMPDLRFRRSFRMEDADGPKALSSHHDYLFVGDTHYRTIRVVDLTRFSTLRMTINPPTETGAMAVSPDDNELWMCSPHSGVVQVLSLGPLFARHNPALCAVEATIGPLKGSHPVSIQFSPDGTRVYVLCDESDSVTVIDRATHKGVGTVNIGGRHAAAWAPGPDDTLWVANDDADEVDVLNMRTLRLDHKLLVGGTPALLQVYPGTKPATP